MSRSLDRAVGTAIPGLVASLRPWGVVDAHWLTGPSGSPVLWLATATEEQRHTLEAQPWLATQVRMLFLRYGAAPESISGVRVMLESEQSRDALLDRA
jgi:hypothetical protein